MERIMAQYEVDMTIDLGMVGYRNSRKTFKVRLDPSPLTGLISDALNAARVYELMQITRPGDIWNYILVEPQQIPQKVADMITRAREDALPKYAKIHPWPEGKIPLTAFDNLFHWYYDDTEPEDAAWLTHRESSVMAGYAHQQFTMVNDVIHKLHWRGPLLKHIIKLIQTKTHPFDILTREEAIKGDVSPGPAPVTHTPQFYSKLNELLSDTELVSVAYRGNGDYGVLLAMATEQRSRANRTKHNCENALYLSALVNSTTPNNAWDSSINYFSEGLAHGDLFIEEEGLGANSIKSLIEVHHRRSPGRYILSQNDEGDIKGYEKSSGEGWTLYTAFKQDTRRECMLRIYYDRRFGQQHPMLSFDPKGSVIYAHERVLLVHGSQLETEVASSLSEILKAWKVHGVAPLVVSLAPSMGLESCAYTPTHDGIPPTATEAELKRWIRRIRSENLPWLDAVILIDCPSWVYEEVEEMINQQTRPWQPILISNPHPTARIDVLLTETVSNQLAQAHANAQKLWPRLS